MTFGWMWKLERENSAACGLLYDEFHAKSVALGRSYSLRSEGPKYSLRDTGCFEPDELLLGELDSILERLIDRMKGRLSGMSSLHDDAHPEKANIRALLCTEEPEQAAPTNVVKLARQVEREMLTRLREEGVGIKRDMSYVFDDDEFIKNFQSLLHSMPGWLLPDRVVLWSRLNASVPRLVGLFLGNLPKRDQGICPRPGDALALSYHPTIKRGDSWVGCKVPAFHVLATSYRLGEPVATSLERFRRFEPLGLKVPDVPKEILESFSVDAGDLKALSPALDGNGPWIAKAHPIHLIKAAHALDETIGATVRRVQRFAPLGIQVPEADLAALADLRVNMQDMNLLSCFDFLPRDHRPESKVPLSYILWAANGLGKTVGMILEQLKRFTPVGLEVPDVDPSSVAELHVDRKDLVALNVYQEAAATAPDTLVPAIPVLRAAMLNQETLKKTLQRLQPFAVLGFKLPMVDPQKLAGVLVNNEDLMLLSRGLDGEEPLLHDTVVSKAHIRKAAKKLGKPVAQIRERLRQLSLLINLTIE
jgi:hypothetical protein